MGMRCGSFFGQKAHARSFYMPPFVAVAITIHRAGSAHERPRAGFQRHPRDNADGLGRRR
jgi:hypothetical protein